jgi:shikimate dehydrogenase
MISDETIHIDIRLEPDLDNYAVMGNPVYHSKSPLIHKVFAEQTGQKLFYQAIYVELNAFSSAIQTFSKHGGKGLNITLPFKGEAYQCATRLSDRARMAQAVNTLTFHKEGVVDGDNTDGIGLVRDLANNYIEVSGRRILIIGAGGAVRGILSPLLQLEPEGITVANRTFSRAQDLVSSYKGTSELVACELDTLARLGSFDLVINGTSSGLSGELPSLPESIINAETSCYDMVYGDIEPVFVKWSRNVGANIALDGLGMLVEQAAESFYIWRGVRPETAPVIAMLRGNM